jgi:transposase
MDKRKRYTAEEKIKILREVMEDGRSISAVAEKHGLSPNNIFKWRKQLFENGVRLFEIKREDISEKAEGRKVAALEEKLREKDEVIAELAGELLGLKKELWPEVGGGKVSLETRGRVEAEIGRIREKTGIPLCRLLEAAGIPERTWREWSERRGQETRHNNNIRRSYYLTPEETAAIIAYCAGNPLKGYRILCWEMVDKNIAGVSASSVSNVIKRHNLDKK